MLCNRQQGAVHPFHFSKRLMDGDVLYSTGLTSEELVEKSIKYYEKLEPDGKVENL